MYVIKRSGEKVELDIEKVHGAAEWSCQDIQDVSVSQLELSAKLKFYDGIKTADIQNSLILAASDLISEETPNYQYVAAKLILWSIYKEVFGGLEPLSLYDITKRNIDLGFYTEELLEWYSKEEFEEFNDYMCHERDLHIAYAGMEIARTKYLIRNRFTKKILETPQIMMMLIAMTFFHGYEKDRTKYIKEFYDALSNQYIVLPTPIMAGLRGTDKQFASCVLIESADSLKSIYATTTAVGLYIARKAGIGIGGGALRSLGSAIRNGQTTHTGKFSFYNLWASAVNSANQGGVRKGSGNLNFCGWDREFRDLIVLKNNKGTPETRIQSLDYTVQLCRLFYQRLIEGGNISLFSTSEVPGLYDAFYRSNEEFEELYVKYEKDKKIPRETISAVEYFTILMTERKETGRIYIMNVDHANSHSSFLEPVRMTNLCCEITLCTSPFEDAFNPDDNAEIALCTLSSINIGKIKKPEQFEKYANLLVRALDELFDYQDYFLPASEKAKYRRSLGIGIAGWSHWKAKNEIKYDTITPEQLDLIDTYAQAFSYYLIKASVELAKEKGPCEYFNRTKYSEGKMPIDTYYKNVDELIPHKEKFDWITLRQDLLDYGIRNSTLMSGQPGETSTIFQGATNGFEDPRALVSVKINKDQVTKQVVPNPKGLGKKYDYLWEQKSPRGYLKALAIWQKYMDQAISFNMTYNPRGEDLDMNTLIEDTLLFYKYGGKCQYYFNTNDAAGEVEIKEEDFCEACAL